MKPTKKQLKEIAKVEKKVAEVCDDKKSKAIFDEITGVQYAESEIKPQKKIEVTLNDKGVIINKETGEPHFRAIDIDEMKKLVEEKKSRDISIALGFGESAPTLKIQIEKQGFKISKGIIEDAEEIRTDLHALKKVGILKNKELLKCFKRLSKKICKVIVNSEIKDGEVATHTKTIVG